MQAKERVKQLNRVSYITIAINLVLGTAVLAAGLVARSTAVLSDSINTLSDVLFSIVVMAGVSMGGKAKDKGHNYGHERYESVASILLSGLLVAVALGVGWQGIQGIGSAVRGELARPGMIAVVAAAASILIKESLFRYARSVARRLNSTALMADAWHHRSDVLSSLGALIGAVGAMLGLPILDPIASLVICLLVLKMAVDIFREAVGQITDRAAPSHTTEHIRDIIAGTKGVIRLDDLKTRLHGNVLFIDAEISVEGDLSVWQGHEIATDVHNRVEDDVEEVKHVNVHVNPM